MPLFRLPDGVTAGDVLALTRRLDALKVPRSAEVERHLAADQAMSEAAAAPPASLPGDPAGLTAEDIGRWADSEAVRTGLSESRKNQLARLRNHLAACLAGVLAEDVPRILDALKPRFEEAARGVHSAVQAGIRPESGPEDVIELGTAAIKAWKALPGHVAALDETAGARVELSRVLGVEPFLNRAQRLLGEKADYAACFSTLGTGLPEGQRGGLGGAKVWLALARQAGGQLTLRDPADTAQTLHGPGESPGWIISAISAVVTDAEGRHLMLYRHDWLPSWVDEEQVQRLLDAGLLTAAHSDATRPPDHYPLTDSHDAQRPRALT